MSDNSTHGSCRCECGSTDGSRRTITRAPSAEEAGYPTEDLDAVLTEAEERYLAKVEQHGPGKNWLAPDAPEARWHIWKACDELFQARDCAEMGRADSTRGHLADALNHMLMAMEIARHDPE